MQNPPPHVRFPIKENSSLVDEGQIFQYLHVLFSNVEWHERRWLNLRGIGEKGTRQETTFHNDVFLNPSEPGARERLLEMAHRYAQHHVAFFCVPCVLREPRGTSANVELFTALVADLDSGNTLEKLAHLERHLGPATMVVASGGITMEGTDKIHVYYKLDRPCDNVPLIVQLRDAMARKAGGDKQFGIGVESNPYGRAHQPIRIAGSCHAKSGKARGVRISVLRESSVYTIEGITAAVEAMPPGPWFTPEQAAAAVAVPTPGLTFAPDMDGTPSNITTSLTEKVYEGGDDKTRWSEFSKVAGHYIRMAREARMSTDSALEATQGWVLANMVPPWPDHRVEKEFRALLHRDTFSNGPMPKAPAPALDIRPPAPIAPPSPVSAPNPTPVSHLPVTVSSQLVATHPVPTPVEGILAWAAHRWVTDPKPTHRFLVDRLVIQGEPHLFVSEGGAGKTYQVLDLAMKIAAYDQAKKHGITLSWCGQEIKAGGRVVAILNEDSQNELHIRMKEIDQLGLIAAAHDNLIVLPMASICGAFPLVERDQRTGQSVSSPAWTHLLDALAALPGETVLLAIDTFNSVAHGDENSAIATNEMMREARKATARLRCALMMTHHLRKMQADQPIRSLAELGDAIRGSSAIQAAFRICFGMFRAVDYDRRMKAMGLRPQKDSLWRFGIAKCNINGLFRGEKTLLRAGNGLLEDVTDGDKYNAVNTAEREAWLILSVVMAARKGHPYSNGGKTAKSGLYSRRAELPPILRKVGSSEFSILIENALQDGKLVLSAKGSKDKKWLDEPGGLIATDDPDAVINAGAYTPEDFNDYVYRPADKIVLHKDSFVEPFQNGIGPGQAMASAIVDHPEIWRQHMKGAVDD